MSKTEPKERIIKAAFEIFGEKGYKSTTIREICKKADVSLALVNYHFRNKKNLYEVIVTTTIEKAFKSIPEKDFLREEMSPEERLRNFIRMLMYRLFSEKGLGTTPTAVKLMAKELTSPTEAMDIIYNSYLRRMLELMYDIFKNLAGDDIDKENYMRFVSSIAGQCLHPLLARELLSRAGFELSSRTEDIEKHAEHIYRFSLSAIKGYSKVQI